MLLRSLLIALALLHAPAAGASDSQLMEAALRADCVPSRVTPLANSEQASTWLVHCRGHGEDTIVVTCIASDCWASRTQETEAEED